MNFDEKVFFAINDLAAIQILIPFWKLVVNEYFVPVLLSLVILYLWISPFKRNKEGVVLAALSVGLVNLIIKLTNLAFFRDRPFVDHQVNLLFYKPTDSSFPANSVAVVFVLAAAVYYIDRKIGRYAFLVAAIFALSRIVVGVHYPSDVLVGALLGVGICLLLSRFRSVLVWMSEVLVRLLRIFGLEPLY